MRAAVIIGGNFSVGFFFSSFFFLYIQERFGSKEVIKKGCTLQSNEGG